jgi:myosin-crossreactive antigen
LVLGGFIFQQDGARPHTAQETQDLLEEEAPGFIKKNDWPAYSPDLNPCDYRLWAWMVKKVYEFGNPANLQALRQKIEEVWAELSAETCKQWLEEFKPRLEKCIERNGNHIQHFFNKI